MYSAILGILITILILLLIAIFFSAYYTIYAFKRDGKFFVKKTTKYSHNRATFVEISKGLYELQKENKGALIVVQNTTPVDNFVFNETLVDSKVSFELIQSIFSTQKSLLHDGAIIISNNRIVSANAFIKNLSLTKSTNHFGTRHRASFALSEETDAYIFCLSEETTKITLFHNGKYKKIKPTEIKDLGE